MAVFPGKDGSFEMVEDDGETLAYTQGQTRVTVFAWGDNMRTLTWTVNGTFADAHTFVNFTATVYFPSGTKTSTTVSIAQGGQVRF